MSYEYTVRGASQVPTAVSNRWQPCLIYGKGGPELAEGMGAGGIGSGSEVGMRHARRMVCWAGRAVDMADCPAQVTCDALRCASSASYGVVLVTTIKKPVNFEVEGHTTSGTPFSNAMLEPNVTILGICFAARTYRGSGRLAQ